MPWVGDVLLNPIPALQVYVEKVLMWKLKKIM